MEENRENDPKADILELAARVYEGLSEQGIEDIERIALDRENFFSSERSSEHGP